MELRILVADDHKFVRGGLVKIIKAAGHTEVIEAENGREAVELFSAQKPDLVLLDMQMPLLNGIEACREIRALNSDVKIAMLTMHEAEDVRQTALEAGADEFMLKSEAPQKLKELISRLIGG